MSPRKSGRVAIASRVAVFTLVFGGLTVLVVALGLAAQWFIGGTTYEAIAGTALVGATGLLAKKYFETTIGELKDVFAKFSEGSWGEFRKEMFDLSYSFLLLFLAVFSLTFVGVGVTSRASGGDVPFRPLIITREPTDVTVVNWLQNAMTQQGYTWELAVKLGALSGPPPESVPERQPEFARFAVLFSEADLKPSCEERSVESVEDLDLDDWESLPFNDGVAYNPAYNGDLLDRLAVALASCGSRSRPVVLEVEGYASSEPFDEHCAEYSGRLNLAAANRRRLEVERALLEARRRAGIGEAEVHIRREPYPTSPDAMVEARGFRDRPPSASSASDGEGASPPQDLFTRSAHIRLVDLGECRPDSVEGTG